MIPAAPRSRSLVELEPLCPPTPSSSRVATRRTTHLSTTASTAATSPTPCPVLLSGVDLALLTRDPALLARDPPAAQATAPLLVRAMLLPQARAKPLRPETTTLAVDAALSARRSVRSRIFSWHSLALSLFRIHAVKDGAYCGGFG
jgi:hypothetical protein